MDVPAGFRVIERAAWSAIGRGRTPEGAVRPAGPIDAVEWSEVYVPLAHIVGVHIDARIELNRHLSAAGLGDAGQGPCVIGVAGSVAVGKSTFASTLAALLAARSERPSVRVLSTDGFLRPTAELGDRAGYKGFPDTYDNELFDDVLGRLARGETGISVPRYSHELYDIVSPPVDLGAPDIVILEGVNALGHPADFCTLRVFLDAAEPDVRSWYVERFTDLIDDARTRPESFFAQWTGLSEADARDLAVTVWEAVNLPNLEEHILATRARADFVVHQGPDHRVEAVAVRDR
ncbi:MAG: type I pantothenate kinase [Acidimicrobiales bacterium]